MDRITEELGHGWWVVSHEQKLWLPKGGLPYGEAANFDLVGQHALQIGEWQGELIWLAQQQRRYDMGSARQVIDLDVGLFRLAGRGVQLAEFYRLHKHCGYCGHEMYPSKIEWATLCSHRRECYYPQTAPYTTVAICCDDSIFPVQHTRHRSGVYTVLAGFVEVGEILEQAVAREVMEESGIKVKNLRYVTFQSWPFPQSLMTVLMVEYDSGDTVIDPKGLLEASWYRYDDPLSLLPPGTVARRLIEDTVVTCRAEYE